MSAVTILLVVLIGAINAISYIMLDKQSDNVLHMIADGDDKFSQKDFPDRGPFMPQMNMDTLKSARFFLVRIDKDGNVQDVNVDQISSVTAEQAAHYATLVNESNGKIGQYKYEVKKLAGDDLIFFMDASAQTETFVMVLSISCGIALICWVVVLIFVILMSEKTVRPILAGIDKQKQFITNAGHELKTPLTIIQSNNDASALINGETKYSQNIRRQTRRLNALMNDLLTLARLDEEIKLPTESVKLTELIGDMITSYENIFEERKLSLTAELQPNVVIEAHQESLSQMISIILDNAAKYTPDGGKVTFTLRTVGKQVEFIEENTCDDSFGGDPERLFERFYRGDSSRTHENGVSGYGIGLSAARAIAESFGGRLTADYTKEGTIRFVARF